MTATPLDGQDVPCRRRPHSTWIVCPCPPCRDAARAQNAAYRAGTWTRVTPEEAWAVLDVLVARDWTPAAMASAAGLPLHIIAGALTIRRRGNRHHPVGYQTRFGPVAAARIVQHGEPWIGDIGTVGTRRRIRALLRIGWPLTAIADRAGVSLSSVCRAQYGTGSGPGTRTRADVAAAIAGAYDQLRDTPGTDWRVCQEGADAGWAPPYAWDGVDIDDPQVTLEAYPKTDDPAPNRAERRRRKRAGRR